MHNFQIGIIKERLLKSGQCLACYGDGWNDIVVEEKEDGTVKMRRMFCFKCDGTGRALKECYHSSPAMHNSDSEPERYDCMYRVLDREGLLGG